MEANRHNDLISVIMPCYNAEKYLTQAIESVFSQTYSNVELIVIDDGSTDGSINILRTYGDRLTLLEQNHQGPYPARNRGLKASHGKYVAFLDADDYWAADCLAELHQALTSGHAELVYCGWQNVGIAGRRGNPYIPPDYEREGKVAAFLKSGAPWPIHAALTRRVVLDEVEGFSEAYGTSMDYDLWIRIGATREIKRVPKVLAFYRHHLEGQISSKVWPQARNSWLVKKAFIKRFPELARQIPTERLVEFVDGALLARGYDAYWRRDLTSAQKIFRLALKTTSWTAKDLKFLLPALLPQKLYTRMIEIADRRRQLPLELRK